MTEIRIIGPSGVGKTTYLATLAAFPQKNRFRGFQIDPRTRATEELVNDAENILKQGSRLVPTEKQMEYELNITIPATKTSPKVQLELLTIDYAGEIFEDLAKDYRWDDVKDYLDDFLTAQGLMVMVTDWDSDQDRRLYQPAFKKIWERMTARQKINPEIRKLRIAVIMAKCERGELWPGRIEPGEDLFSIRLPETYNFLINKFPPHKLQFFACSSFGILGPYNPRPNRQYSGFTSELKSDTAILREPNDWKPYGIFAPIYWLSTEKFLYEDF